MDPREKGQWERALGASITEMVSLQRSRLLITRRGNWVVKPVRRPEHLLWWSRVDRELRIRGFQRMPVFRTDGYRWIFTEWVNGQTASYRRKEELVRTAGLLAHFHRAGKGLFTPACREAAFLLSDRLDSRLRDFFKLWKERRDIPGEAGHLLRRYGFRFYRLGEEAWNRLDQLPWEEWIRWERGCRFLTHRDLASHNVLLDRTGGPWLIDFETADYDGQVGDLWQLLSRGMCEHNWDLQVFREVVGTYESIRPLSSLEKRLLTVLLGFPNEFYRELSGLIRKKPGYRKEKTLPHLRRIIRTVPLWRRFLWEIDCW
ncbi:phosphotransferase [Paludifilum halophilum]|uniref:Aminoglycoside phosphotransferase domain-containing protein n=1 Tax=Paludifilum halophilum TaxID=1642702 RepID=A0A235BDA9_9BACL|nr:phosphotransferase [Paludifilum halophilum]OYD09917.1 hypothetical protein CHM34_02785 [Paludifilum halophilum]